MNNILDIRTQERLLKKAFPNSYTCINDTGLYWWGDIWPSAMSSSYTLKVEYVETNGIWTPHTYVERPRCLRLAKGHKHLPHVYSEVKQELCLYDNRYAEWDATMPLVSTIIPWASEWLFYYEIWLITGIWHGGGNHPDVNLGNYINDSTLNNCDLPTIYNPYKSIKPYNRL